ncbi:MAG TPA: YggT family protein [Solirubrobacterales bacterium]|jgi:uncharacterized protein YggT (Ycf19 family)|nr:YggT family protein [Solirubrobacterales bacterium]
MLAALTRTDAADYVSTLIYIYILLILIRILISWIPRMPYNRYLMAGLRFVEDVTEPYLGLFRRIVPPIGIGGGGLDISPMIAVFVLGIIRSILYGIIAG